jgi:hypothetical protein
MALIDYSNTKPVKEIINLNIQKAFNQTEGLFSIKLDEIAITQRARWSAYNNEIVGFC